MTATNKFNICKYNRLAFRIVPKIDRNCAAPTHLGGGLVKVAVGVGGSGFVVVVTGLRIGKRERERKRKKEREKERERKENGGWKKGKRGHMLVKVCSVGRFTRSIVTDFFAIPVTFPFSPLLQPCRTRGPRALTKTSRTVRMYSTIAPMVGTDLRIQATGRGRTCRTGGYGPGTFMLQNVKSMYSVFLCGFCCCLLLLLLLLCHIYFHDPRSFNVWLIVLAHPSNFGFQFVTPPLRH